MFDELSDLYQQTIIDHSKCPRNFGELKGANLTSKGHNPLCGDNVTVYLLVKNDVITDIKFQGSGCAISLASASVMTEVLKGKTITQAKTIFDIFHNLIVYGKITEETGVEKLITFAGINKFPARVKCATLSWHAINAAIESKGK